MAESKKNLYQKLVQIMKGMGTVEKKGFNKFDGYSYVRQADLVEKLQALCVEHNVFVFFSCEDFDSKQVETSTGKPNILSSVSVRYTFVNADNPEERFEALSAGEGMDRGDKAIYKALTGADKYMFRNTFLVGSEEDAEKESPGISEAPKSNGKQTPAAKIDELF